MSSSNDTLARLADVIDARRGGDPDKSYVARLFFKGHDAILKKIGEEATEVVMAAKDGDRPRIVGELEDYDRHHAPMTVPLRLSEMRAILAAIQREAAHKSLAEIIDLAQKGDEIAAILLSHATN